MPILTAEQEAERRGRMTETAVRAGQARAAIEPLPTPEYSYAQGLAAQFRQENLFYWAMDRLNRRNDFGVDPDFDPQEHLGSYRRHLNEFPEMLRARSASELIAIQNRIDQQARDRRVIQSFSFLGQLALAPAVLFSPENLIPFGTALRAGGYVGKTAIAATRAARAARGFRAAAATGGRVSFEAAASAAVAEGLLQSSQPFRTREEGVFNVVGSGVFGFMLGSAGKSLGIAKSKALKELSGVESVAELDEVAEKTFARVLDRNTEEGKKLTETLDLFADSPATFVFSDKNPVRGLVLDALKETNPKLAKLMALDNRFGRFVTGALMFQPATRLARSQLQESRVLGKVLTGHFMVDDVPKGGKGLSVEGMMSLAEIATLRMFKEQADVYHKHIEALKGIDERVFEFVGFANRRGDKVSDRLSWRGDESFDPFKEIRSRPDAVAAVEELAKVNRDFLDIVFRTADAVGALTKGPRHMTDEQRVAALLDETYLPRLMDQDYIRLNSPRFRKQIEKALDHAKDHKVREYGEEIAELETQAKSAGTKEDRAYLERRIAELQEEVRLLNDPAGFRDLAISVESNYTVQPRDRQVARQSPLRKRTLEIDETFLEEFMVNDVRQLQQRILRSVIPDLVLADQMDFRFGSSVAGTDTSLMRALAKSLESLDDRIEKFRETGEDAAGLDDLAREMGDILDDATEAELSNLIRLLDEVEGNDLTALRKQIEDALVIRKGERLGRVEQVKALRAVRRELAGLVAQSRAFRSERADVRFVEKTDPDLALTEAEYRSELVSVSKKLAEASERVGETDEVLDVFASELPEEEWHAVAIGLGYRPDEVAAMQRFMELVPPTGFGVEQSPTARYEAWRSWRHGQSPTGLIVGSIADMLRKTQEGIVRASGLEGRVTEDYFAFTETLLRRRDFLDRPEVKADARIIDQAGSEVRRLERERSNIEKRMGEPGEISHPDAPGAKSGILSQEEYLAELRKIEARVDAAEKPNETLTEDLRRRLESGEASGEGWEQWSRDRGYTEAEIADFRRWLELAPPEPAVTYRTDAEMYAAWRKKQGARAGDDGPRIGAEELSSLRSQNEFLLNRLDELRASIEDARIRRAEIHRELMDSRSRADAVSKQLEAVAKKIHDQAGNAAASMAPPHLQIRRNDLLIEEGLSPDGVMRKVDALNRYVHARVAEVRRTVFSLNTGTEHLTKMMDRGYKRDYAGNVRQSDGHKLTAREIDQNLRALDREKDAVITEIERMRNRHGINDGDLAVWGKRLRDLNYMTKQGGILLASLPDLAMAITTAGMVPYANAMARNLKTIFTGKFPKNTMAEWLYAVEMAMGIVRHQKLLGIDDDFDIPMRSKLDQRLANTRDAFTRLTLIRRWNAFNKAVAYQAIESRVAKGLLKGESMSKIDRQMMGFLGISDDDFADLQKVVQIAGSDDEAMIGRFNFLNTRDWRHENPAFAGWDAGRLRNLRLTVEGAITKGVYDTIITQSAGDLPAFATKTPLGRMLMQFRGWSLSVLQRYTIPALQRMMKNGPIEDPGPALTAIFATVMGMAVYATQKYLRGEDPFEAHEGESLTETLISEGMDRGGAFGFLSEVTSTAIKVSPWDLGFGPTSRFESRNAFDAAMGPTAGLIRDFTQLPYVFDDDYTSEDGARIRRMVVGQNLLQLRLLLDVGPSVPDIGQRRYFKDFMQIQDRAAEAVGLDVN